MQALGFSYIGFTLTLAMVLLLLVVKKRML